MSKGVPSLTWSLVLREGEDTPGHCGCGVVVTRDIANVKTPVRFWSSAPNVSFYDRKSYERPLNCKGMKEAILTESRDVKNLSGCGPLAGHRPSKPADASRM